MQHDLSGSGAEHVPSIMGKYRLLTDLGHGGMAHVFLAIAQGPSGFSKLVVLKMLRRSLALDPDTVSMFLDEARLAGRLSHPNVVHTYEVGEEAGRYLLVMEYLEGQPLSAIIRRAKDNGARFPLSMHLRVLIDALSGLHYAHELKDFGGRSINLVHRDISPQNIFVTYDGHVKVLDFGIAKAITSASETKTGILKGKVPYMAPEQFLGLPVDRRADIYSMGAVLWQAATGERLWKGASDVEVISKVSRGEIPSPSEHSTGIAESLNIVCAKALAFERDNRYVSATELEQELEVVVEGLDSPVTLREVGAYVAAAFAEDRAALAHTIESRTKKFASSKDGIDLGTLLVRPQPFGSSSFLLTSVDSQYSNRQLETGALRAIRVPDKQLSSSADSSISSPSQVAALTNSIPITPPPPLVGSHQRTGSIFATGAFALSLAAAFFILRSTWSTQNLPPPAPSTAPPLRVGSVTNTNPPGPIATITIAVSPPNARVFFDGLESADNPLVARVPRDSALHYVSADAPGFAKRLVEVRADGNTTFNLHLDHISSVAVRAKDAVRHPDSAAPSAPVLINSAPPTTRPVDHTNPWDSQ